MATTYTSTIDVTAWKEHTCSGCGTVFRYPLRRKESAQGHTPEAAQAAARAAAARALARKAALQPCPSCGLYKPDMVGAHKARRHRWLIPAALLVPALTVSLYSTDVLPAGTAALVTAGLCGLLVLAHGLIDLANPNRNLQANRRLAQRRLEQGRLCLVSGRAAATMSETPATAPGSKSGLVLAYALLVLGPLAFLAPELIRLAHGWPVNKEWVPVVVGPGDQPYTYLEHPLTSIKSYWSAAAPGEQPTDAATVWSFLAQLQGQQSAALGPAPYLLGVAESVNPVWQNLWFVRVANAEPLSLHTHSVRASSRISSWGILSPQGDKVITVHQRDVSRESPSTLWLRVHLPEDAELEGKTLQLDLQMRVLYPQDTGTGWRESSLQVPAERKTLLLASAHAGRRYQLWWWGGFLVGTCLTVVPGLLLVRLSRNRCQRAHPTRTWVSDEPAAAAVPQPEPPSQAVPDGQGRSTR
jgi:hypothetical protein